MIQNSSEIQTPLPIDAWLNSQYLSTIVASRLEDERKMAISNESKVLSAAELEKRYGYG